MLTTRCKHIVSFTLFVELNGNAKATTMRCDMLSVDT